ncbi:MAG TPA: heme-binding protein [Acidimicrobiales bacterium]|nr:heme-binding protein [Acidimicrobiales bacterium]
MARELTLEDASALCRAALAVAEAEQALVSVAVVDAGGHLVAFARMDGAEIAGPTLATDKAFTAVAHRATTASLAELAAPGGELAGLASNGGGRYVVFGGGVPIWSAGRVVGGVGVSGGSVAQDTACAAAASHVWEERCSNA